MQSSCRHRNMLQSTQFRNAACAGVLMLLIAAAADAAEWARVTENDVGIKIETDKLEAVIPKKQSKRCMTGIEKQTGKDGPWLAGMTLEPSVVYEAWCAQWPSNFLIMIEEIHGRPVKAGESFSAAHLVGYFDTIDDMHKVYNRCKGHTALTADPTGWRLVK